MKVGGGSPAFQVGSVKFGFRPPSIGFPRRSLFPGLQFPILAVCGFFEAHTKFAFQRRQTVQLLDDRIIVFLKISSLFDSCGGKRAETCCKKFVRAISNGASFVA